MGIHAKHRDLVTSALRRQPGLSSRSLLLAFLVTLLSCECGPSVDDVDENDPGPPTRAADRAEAIAELPAPRLRDDQWHRGVSLGLFVSDPDPAVKRRIYGEMLDEIVAVGASDVQLVVRQVQPTIESNEIGPHDEYTYSDDLLREVIAMARERKLRVFLMPIVHILERAPDDWRGTLDPEDLDAWWRSYQRFILHYARLSHETGVATYAVGSELVSMERYADRWRALIKQVRAVFRGTLTYSANWDHYEPVTFWDDVDVVGLTGYHELTRRRNPTQQQIEQGWLSFTNKLRSWATRENRTYILTEIGYPANPYAAATPWDYRERGRPDPALQLRCYRAMYTTWHDDERLAGIYVWNWFGHRALTDRGYSPRGKPSEHVLNLWFRRSR